MNRSNAPLSCLESVLSVWRQYINTIDTFVYTPVEDSRSSHAIMAIKEVGIIFTDLAYDAEV